MGRYTDREILINRSESNLDLRIPRRKSAIEQYGTSNLKHLDPDQISQLTLVSHVWKLGDRFYKLAYKYYGDSQLWWVIAHFNKTPTEGHVAIGNVIYVPLPLLDVLRMIRGI